jgi:lipopolysaccharide biosynthesis glycosyltransferase
MFNLTAINGANHKLPLAAGADIQHRVTARVSLRHHRGPDPHHRRAHARHVFDFDAFDIDVLVLDLARLRKDDAGGQMLAWIQRFGLTAAEALALYAGPDRAPLPPRWAHIPTHERVADPMLVHWPGAAKPWKRWHAARQELWWRAQEQARPQDAP